jgi:hypothetical protein
MEAPAGPNECPYFFRSAAIADALLFAENVVAPRTPPQP